MEVRRGAALVAGSPKWLGALCYGLGGDPRGPLRITGSRRAGRDGEVRRAGRLEPVSVAEPVSVVRGGEYPCQRRL